MKQNYYELYRNLSITDVAYGSRFIQIAYVLNEKEGIAMLYQHSDNSWHIDQETAAFGEAFIQAIMRKTVIRELRIPERKAKQNHRVPVKKQKPKRKGGIRVWFADDTHH